MEGKMVSESERGYNLGALIMILVGSLFLAENILHPLLGFSILNWSLIWPVLLIFIGLRLLARKA